MTSETIRVGGVETFSTVDYPDHLAAVIFMQGCPWRCPFCYNTELQDISKASDFIWEKFVDFLRSRRGVLDAVVFSGGEPLLQNALPQAISQVKELGYKIGLHTGGCRPKLLAAVLPQISWVGFDIKAPFDVERYQQVTGPDHLAAVLQSLELLLASGLPFECRTTCDPRLLKPADLITIGKALAAKGVKRYFLQKYRPVPADKTTTDEACEAVLAPETVAQLSKMFETFDVRR